MRCSRWDYSKWQLILCQLGLFSDQHTDPYNLLKLVNFVNLGLWFFFGKPHLSRMKTSRLPHISSARRDDHFFSNQSCGVSSSSCANTTTGLGCRHHTSCKPGWTSRVAPYTIQKPPNQHRVFWWFFGMDLGCLVLMSTQVKVITYIPSGNLLHSYWTWP